jgi:hypothetical protein
MGSPRQKRRIRGKSAEIRARGYVAEFYVAVGDAPLKADLALLFARLRPRQKRTPSAASLSLLRGIDLAVQVDNALWRYLVIVRY